MAIKKQEDKIGSGMPGFDQMTEGGFEKGSNNIISGTPGTGKTTLCMQFLLEGARKGEKGMYISLSEPVEKMVLHYERFNWPLAELTQKGSIKLAMYPHQFTQQVGEPTAKVTRLVDQIKFLLGTMKDCERLVIDSISLLGYKYESKAAQRNELSYLFSYLNEASITCLFITERDVWDNTFTFEDFLGDSVVVLQDVIKDFDRKRGVSIIKMRGARIDRTVRPYEITTKGFVVYPDSQII